MLVQEPVRQGFITQEAITVYNTQIPFTTTAAAVVYTLIASVTRTNKNEHRRGNRVSDVIIYDSEIKTFPNQGYLLLDAGSRFL